MEELRIGMELRSNISADRIAARLGALRLRLGELGGSTVEIMAVTKGQPPVVARRAVEAGLTMLGENYASELEAKAAELRDLAVPPAWHFIGGLQRNKIRRLAGEVTRWDSVDRDELVDELVKREPGAAILVQVNVCGEPAKGGCAPNQAAALVERGLSGGLDVQGLMAIGKAGDLEATRAGFAALRRLCDQLTLRVCSMGMSGDLDVAVAEGSTLIRVGTALFGPRPTP